MAQKIPSAVAGVLRKSTNKRKLGLGTKEAIGKREAGLGQRSQGIGYGMLAKQLGLGPYRPMAAGPKPPQVPGMAGMAPGMGPGVGAALGLGGIPAGATGIPGAPKPTLAPAKARLY